jgi:hypothetical protein
VLLLLHASRRQRRPRLPLLPLSLPLPLLLPSASGFSLLEDG